METAKSKIDVAREHSSLITQMRQAGSSLKQISVEVSRLTGVGVNTSTIFGVLREIEEKDKEEVVLSLSPEKKTILDESGMVRLTHNGVSYLIESKKFCCKKLQKYARYRGQLVMKFKLCPYCGAKR